MTAKHLSVKLKGICRPKEYVSFLETHFRDALLDYESNPEQLKRLLYKDKLESWYIQRRARQAVNGFLTDKEKARLKVSYEFQD